MANSSRVGQKKLLHVGSYEVGKTLGNGSFGKVKLGTNVFTKEKVAIKFFNHKKFATLQQVENTHREIEIMKLLSHPNIVKLVDVIEKPDESTTYLIAEYVSGGELFDYIVANGVVKEKQARHFMRQIISAVEFCHANLIVHRDLKPENLLLDANGNIKISDFGLSNMIEPGKLLDSFCGSPLYAAPEILLAERYVGPPIDVWSIGVILFALLCGHLPWNGESQAEISHNSIKGIYEEPLELSVSGRDIIRKMLNPNPRERITIAEIRKHQWINEGYDSPPATMLSVRQPVFEIRDDIIEQLVGLGFKNEEEIRKQILDNECCQVVAMYHLILDKKVADELAELKKNMLTTVTPVKVQQPTGKQPISKLVNMNAKISPLRTLTAIVEEEANEISPDEWNKIQESDEEHEDTVEHETIKPTTVQPPSAYSHKHDQTDYADYQIQANSPCQPESGRHSKDHHHHYNPRSNQPQNATQYQPQTGRSQLSSSVPGLSFSGRHRRNSVATDMVHNHSQPQTSDEFGSARNHRHQRRDGRPHQQQQQQQQQHQQQSQPDVIPPPRGRKFSLDSRALMEQKQMSQEYGGGGDGQTQTQPAGPGAPRLVKGVFKSSTTTTRPPPEAAKLVKKVLSNSSFFVKRKSPFIFECFDEENGVKFQLEVCKISQLDMTGIHLKRLVGDIWLYKNMCTSLVNKLCL